MTPGDEKLLLRWFDPDRLDKIIAERLALLTRLQAQEIITGDTYHKAIEQVKASITRLG